jgi:hypothetical protein
MTTRKKAAKTSKRPTGVDYRWLITTSAKIVADNASDFGFFKDKQNAFDLARTSELMVLLDRIEHALTRIADALEEGRSDA